MSLINVVLILVVVGALLYLVKLAPFIDGQIKQIITWVVIVAVVLWLVSLFVPALGLHDLYIGVRK